MNALEMLPHAYAAADPCPVEHIASALRVIAEDKKVPAADSIIYSQSTRESTIDEGPEGYPVVARPEERAQCLICHTVCPANAIVHKNHCVAMLVNPGEAIEERYRNTV